MQNGRTLLCAGWIVMFMALTFASHAAVQITIWSLPRTNSISDGDLILVARITGGVSNVLAMTKGDLLAGASSALNFDSAQFALINGTNVTIISGASLTNLLAKGSFSSLGPIYSGGLVVTNGMTNLVLTASRALVSDANKGVVSSTVTATELGYLSGVTSALQTQIGALASTAALNTASNALLVAASNRVQVAAGSGVTVTPSGASGIETYTVAASGAGGSATNIPTWMSLSSSISVGDTTLAVSSTPLAGFGSKSLALAVDPYTTNCEVRAINSLSASTFTVDSQFRIAHSSGATVLLLPHMEISPAFYAAKADGTTDDWPALQRAIVELAPGGQLYGGCDLDGRSFIFKQPLYFGEFRARELRLITSLTWPTNLVQTTETNVAAAMKNARNYTTFTSGHTTNAILFPSQGNGFEDVGKTVSLNNPYGETLPGGIVSGRMYLIKTAGAGYITLSEISTPATELDITSNGTGWIWGNMGSLTRVKWDKVRLSIRSTNLNGVYLNLQQQAFTRELRVDMEWPGRTNTGVQIVGQGSCHYNLEVDPYTPGTPNEDSTNQTAISIEGVYHVFSGLTTVNGFGGHALKVTGRGIKMAYLLAEKVQRSGVQIRPGCQDFRLEQWYWSASNTNTPFLDDLSLSDSTYHLGSGITGSSDVMIARDVTRGYTIAAWDGTMATGLGDTDNSNVYPGHYQMSAYYGPIVHSRRTHANMNDSRAFRHIDQCFLVDSSATSRTITLSDAAGWRGLDHEIIKTTSGNSVFILPKTRFTATITITNTPTNGMGITNGVDIRLWSNTNSVPTEDRIVVTNSISASATNLLAQITAFPYSGVLVSQTATNIITLTSAAALNVSAGVAWASIVLTSNHDTINSLTNGVTLTNINQVARFRCDGTSNWHLLGN